MRSIPSRYAKAVGLAWLATRLLLAAAAVGVVTTTGRTPERVLANWDVLHFFAIADNGYADPLDVAFFPGLPMLLHLGDLVGIAPLSTGVALSVSASFLAASALYRLGGGNWVGAAAAIAWLLAPTTVFTFVPYTESIFCALAFWAWERARREHWAAAAALAAGACAFRVSGLFLIAALGVMVLTQRAAEVRPVLTRLSRLAWLLLPTAVIGAYVVYLRLTRGSWTAWFEAQSTGWSRGVHNPWDALQTTIRAATPGYFSGQPTWHWLFKAELVSMAIGLLLTIALLVLRRWAEATWVGLQVVAFATSSWFISVNRAVLLWFPLWLLIGQAIAWVPEKPWAQQLRLALLTVLAVGAAWLATRWAVQFYYGDWAS